MMATRMRRLIMMATRTSRSKTTMMQRVMMMETQKRRLTTMATRMSRLMMAMAKRSMTIAEG